jgi:hypothetical protein
MTCSCEKRCKTRRAMTKRHGTPSEFETAVWRAYCEHGGIDESYEAIDKYRREWLAAP